MIPVNKPFLPPKEIYSDYVNGIWERNWLTNNGPLVNELELKLKEYLGMKHLLFLTNGTIALQIAIKALGLSGEVITTPFSYVATASSIVWEGCEPVFADIDIHTLNIDPKKIARLVTSRTTAILATHVYGNPCDVEAIEKIAIENNLKVIYDAAHCFGTMYKGKSVFEYGDISTTSFHATKLFHTIEGGAVFTKDPELLKKMAYMRNFGHDGPEVFSELGINGKNSEFHAAMGLANLPFMPDILKSRKEQCDFYNEALLNLKKQFVKIIEGAAVNFAYYPIVLPSKEITEKYIKALNENLIYPRRYFCPSLNELPYVKNVPLPVSDDISQRVICLPLYYTLTREEIHLIARILLRIQNN